MCLIKLYHFNKFYNFKQGLISLFNIFSHLNNYKGFKEMVWQRLARGSFDVILADGTMSQSSHHRFKIQFLLSDIIHISKLPLSIGPDHEKI